MRADRLVAILLLLQAKGRVTARMLADELEVSIKTARRDLEALAVAGIPVYAQVGRGGGWSLVGGARTDLSGLTAAEARALFLIAGPSASVAPEAKAALRKLLAALPEPFRADASAAASAVVLDAARWGGAVPPAPPHLDALRRAVIDGRQVHLGYVDRRRAATQRTVHPLGIVQKAQSWYLVADTERGVRTFHLGRVSSVAILDLPVVRPEGFDLGEAWRTVVATVEEARTRLRAVLRAPAEAVEALREQFGADLAVVEPAAGGRVLLAVEGLGADRIAEQLAGWGALLEVVAPVEVRQELARIGAELTSLYAGARGVAVAEGGPRRAVPERVSARDRGRLGGPKNPKRVGSRL